MKAIFRTVFTILILITSTICSGQVFPRVEISFEQPVKPDAMFPITATSRGECLYPYSQGEQPPDFQLTENKLEMTIYMRFFGVNTVPIPPCVERMQTYRGPILQSGTYQMVVYVRYLQELAPGTFGARRLQGDFTFQVAEAVPITQIPATSSWSLVLLLLGIFGAARWASGVSGR